MNGKVVKQRKEMTYFDVSKDAKYMDVSVTAVFDEETHDVTYFIITGEEKTKYKQMEAELATYR